MGTYFHIADHARMTCVTAYLNLQTESQKYGKLISKKNVVMVCIDIVVLDQCCCAKNIVGWLWIFCFCFFIELRTKINLSSIIIL